MYLDHSLSPILPGKNTTAFFYGVIKFFLIHLPPTLPATEQTTNFFCSNPENKILHHPPLLVVHPLFSTAAHCIRSGTKTTV
jgi:hypothetical protein